MNLVVGATGNLGGGVCETLCGERKPVRALVRETSDPERVKRLDELGAEVVRGSCAMLSRLCAPVMVW